MTHQASVIERAADYIEEHGLWKSSDVGNQNDGASVCVARAAMLCDEHGNGILATDAIMGYLGLTRISHLFDWNDAEHRTKEQVVKELRACAADLRGEG